MNPGKHPELGPRCNREGATFLAASCWRYSSTGLRTDVTTPGG
ncbi:MAG: hypothetical protein ACKO01_04180 [Erythrobacter sp.]